MEGYHIITSALSLTIWICHGRKWKNATSQVKHCWYLPWRLRFEIGKEIDQVHSVRNIQSFILKTTCLSLHCCNKVIIGIEGCIMERTAVIFFCFNSAFLRVFIWCDCFMIYVILSIYILAYARVGRIWLWYFW